MYMYQDLQLGEVGIFQNEIAQIIKALLRLGHHISLSYDPYKVYSQITCMTLYNTNLFNTTGNTLQKHW